MDQASHDPVLTQNLLSLLILLDRRRDFLPCRRDGLQVGEAQDRRRRAAVGHIGGVATTVQPLDDVSTVWLKCG